MTGITRPELVSCLTAQGFRANGKFYDKRMEDEGKSVIMRFELKEGAVTGLAIDKMYGTVEVKVRVVGDQGGFQLMGHGDLRKMRIVGGKLLGVQSVPKKKRFDRKKHRAAIAEGRVYTRGD